MADLEVTYKGNTILEMNESGTKSLDTSGKYCEDDITIDFTKNEAPNGYTIPIVSGTIFTFSSF